MHKCQQIEIKSSIVSVLRNKESESLLFRRIVFSGKWMKTFRTVMIMQNEDRHHNHDVQLKYMGYKS